MDDTASKIKSCQNGLLLRADINKSSDQHLFSINPDVSLVNHVVFENDLLVLGNHKVVVFSSNTFSIDGKILHLACRRLGDPHCV